jgi:hypothetical protein
VGWAGVVAEGLVLVIAAEAGQAHCTRHTLQTPLGTRLTPPSIRIKHHRTLLQATPIHQTPHQTRGTVTRHPHTRTTRLRTPNTSLSQHIRKQRRAILDASRTRHYHEVTGGAGQADGWVAQAGQAACVAFLADRVFGGEA